MKVALMGGVESSAVALTSLIGAGAEVVGVLGYVPQKALNVSGYVDLVGQASVELLRRKRRVAIVEPKEGLYCRSPGRVQ